MREIRTIEKAAREDSAGGIGTPEIGAAQIEVRKPGAAQVCADEVSVRDHGLCVDQP